MTLSAANQDKLDAFLKKALDPKVTDAEKAAEGQAMMSALGPSLLEAILDAALVKAKMGR